MTMSSTFTLSVDSGIGNTDVAVIPTRRNDSRTTGKSEVLIGRTTGGAVAEIDVVLNPMRSYISEIVVADANMEPVSRIPASGGTFNIIGHSNCSGLFASVSVFGFQQEGDFKKIESADIVDCNDRVYRDQELGGRFQPDFGAEGEYEFIIGYTFPSISGTARTEVKRSVIVSDLTNNTVSSLTITQS